MASRSWHAKLRCSDQFLGSCGVWMSFLFFWGKRPTKGNLWFGVGLTKKPFPQIGRLGVTPVKRREIGGILLEGFLHIQQYFWAKCIYNLKCWHGLPAMKTLNMKSPRKSQKPQAYPSNSLLNYLLWYGSDSRPLVGFFQTVNFQTASAGCLLEYPLGFHPSSPQPKRS